MQTRGERNNNPGNIERTTTKWQGMAADQRADSRFIVFTDAKWGIRAIARILQNYAKGDVDTVREIVMKWAPPSENDSNSYITQVDKMVDGDAETELDDSKKQLPEHILMQLTQAIIKHENGRCIYSINSILEGVRLA